jgi:hypothetical protein
MTSGGPIRNKASRGLPSPECYLRYAQDP